MKQFDYRLTILEFRLDTLGHVNNSVYLQMFEEARWDFISRNGFDLNQVRQSKTGPVILEINIKFQKELRLREEIIIRSEMLEYNGKIAKLKQTMINQKNEVACEAIMVFALFDLEKRQIIAPTEDWLKAIGM